MNAPEHTPGGPAALSATDSSRRMAVLWLVVFVDLLGFGVLIPLVPFYGLRLGLTADWVTLIVALHSLFQFLGAPLLGRLSDRHGRRPVLALSMAGHALAYALLAVPGGIVLLVCSRVLSGITAGNLAAAYAYVGDITPPAQRARGFARISSAFAMGFALGPALGGLLAGNTAADSANLARPAIAAAVLSVIALAGILFWLPESRHRTTPHAPGNSSPTNLRNLLAPLRDAALSVIVLLALMVYIFASMRESILVIWLHDRFSLPLAQLSLLFTINGLTVAAVQFFVTGRLLERIGELTALRVGIACYGVSWLSLVLAPTPLWIYPAVAIGSFGNALFGTSSQALAAQRALPNQRGAVMGLVQSSGSLARFTGAALAGTIYVRVGHNAPLELGALAMLPALWITVVIAKRTRQAASLSTTAE